MLNLLLKKQLMELNRVFFYDAKKNARRSRAASVALLTLYAVVMVGVLGGTFAMLAWALGGSLLQMDALWLYWVIMALLAILLGVFGSVFTTCTSLYRARDNELLLSLPIPAQDVLLARLLGVYLMGLAFSAVVMVPAVVVRLWMAPAVAAALGGLLLTLLVSALVLVLSCLLGWIIAGISVRVRHRSLLAVLALLAFLVVYCGICFRAPALLGQLLPRLEAAAHTLRTSAPPLYLLGCVGEGHWLASLILSAVTAALCALTYRLLSRTFIAMATTPTARRRTVAAERPLRQRRVSAALLGRELRRFVASPNYVVNCSLGTLLLPLAGVALLLRGDMLVGLLAQVPGLSAYGGATVLLCAAICMLAAMNNMVTSSISLDSRTLWLSQSLPLAPWQVLRAKLSAQLLLTVPPVLFCAGCAVAVLRPSLPLALLLLALPVVFSVLSAGVGLALDLRHPALSWTNEITVIKQRIIVLAAMLGGWLYAAALAALFLLTGGAVSPWAYLLLWLLPTTLAAALTLHWLHHTGAAVYSGL